jgi:hypothetical protein
MLLGTVTVSLSNCKRKRKRKRKPLEDFYLHGYAHIDLNDTVQIASANPSQPSLTQTQARQKKPNQIKPRNHEKPSKLYHSQAMQSKAEPSQYTTVKPIPAPFFLR